jgi:serine O-acetyltransferase
MKLSIDPDVLLKYTLSQIDVFFPDGKKYDDDKLNQVFKLTIERVEYCFSRINLKYFSSDKTTMFNHLHGDHYSMYLYLFANSVYKSGYNISLAEKLFLLNKMMFGIDAFFEVKLPNIFLFVHPVGTILGRGTYKDYLIIYQGCNVGANKGIYPNLGHNVTLHPNVSILGNCKIGDNCEFGANSLIIDKHLDNNSIYIGSPKSNLIKTKDVTKNTIWNYE